MTAAHLTEAQREAAHEGHKSPAFPFGRPCDMCDWYVLPAVAEAVSNLRARVEAAIAPWPPGVRKGDVLRALGRE